MSEYPSFSDSPSGSQAQIPNSSMAMISLIAGILGLTFLPLIGSIVALVSGSSAKREILESGGTLGGEGLAQVGIILGWIGIGLSVLGVCAGVIFVIPFCLLAFGLGSGEWGALLPLVLLIT
jgi:hypothetical protein